MEQRHTFAIAPNATATFNTPNPDPRTVAVLQEVVRLAMKAERRRHRIRYRSLAYRFRNG